MRTLGSVAALALAIGGAATLSVHAVASSRTAPEVVAPEPSMEQIDGAGAAAEAQALAINGRR